MKFSFILTSTRNEIIGFLNVEITGAFSFKKHQGIGFLISKRVNRKKKPGVKIKTYGGLDTEISNNSITIWYGNTIILSIEEDDDENKRFTFYNCSATPYFEEGKFFPSKYLRYVKKLCSIDRAVADAQSACKSREG